MTIDYGGNIIRAVDLDRERQDFSRSPYVYFYRRCGPGEEWTVDGLGSCSVFVYEAGAPASVELLPSGERLFQGDAVQAEDRPVRLRVRGGFARLLVAGVEPSAGLVPSLLVVRAGRIKRVSKPWGFEQWINGEHPAYAFKYICINKGFRTSLQYHHFKQETNVLMSGEARCFFKKDPGVSKPEVRENDIGSFSMKAPAVMDIQPGTIHRVESLTDIVLCEVSTPHLDDVVRIADDTNRAGGRIPSEHQ